MSIQYKSTTAKDTEKIAQNLAHVINKSATVLLIGQLGAGKTVFANAFAHALGIDEPLLSPTFTIVREYDRLNHFDLYRIEDEDELFEIGFDEYLAGGKYNLIEWADKFPDVVYDNVVTVSIEYDGDGRVISIDMGDDDE